MGVIRQLDSTTGRHNPLSLAVKSGALAGKGKAIGFASWWVPNANPADVSHIPLEVTVWADINPKAMPEPYPVANPDGIIQKSGKYHPNFKEIAAELLNYTRLHPER